MSFVYCKSGAVPGKSFRAWPLAAILAAVLLIAVSARVQADFPDDYDNFVLADKDDSDKTLAALLAEGETHILLPQGVHQIDNPIVINSEKPLVIHGAGRMKTRIEGLNTDEPLFIFESVGPVSLAGIEFKKIFFQTPGSSLAQQDLIFNNEEFVDVQIQDSYFRAGSIEINGPGKWVIQGSHFDGIYTEPAGKNWVDNGILLNNDGASVFVVGGNFGHFDNAHIEQKKGHLEVYSASLQDHSGGSTKADIIIRSASPHPSHAHIIAGVRSEGNRSANTFGSKLLYVPTPPLTATEDEAAVNVVLKSSHLQPPVRFAACTETFAPDVLADYNASGSLWLLGNQGNKNSSYLVTGNSAGKIYSAGNALLGCLNNDDFFDVTGGAEIHQKNDLFNYRSPNNPLVTSGLVFRFIQEIVAPTEDPTWIDWSTAPIPFVPQNINAGTIPIIHRPAFTSAPSNDFLQNVCSVSPPTCDIQAALNAEDARVYIPAGIYTITSPLVLTQHKEHTGGLIAGAGKGQTIIRCVGCDSVFKTESLSFTTIQGITFELQNTTGSAISLEWPTSDATMPTQGNNFYDVEIIGGRYGLAIGVTSPQQCSENLFVDSIFRDSSEQGVTIGQGNALSNIFHNVTFSDSPWAIGYPGIYPGSPNMAGSWGVLSANIDNISTAFIRASDGGGRTLYHNEIRGNAAAIFSKANNPNAFSYFFDNSNMSLSTSGISLRFDSGQGVNFLRSNVTSTGTYINGGDSQNYIHSILSDIGGLGTSVSTDYRRGFFRGLSDDADRDGIKDSIDNCSQANPYQTDVDGDDVGDACEHGLTGRYYNDVNPGGGPALTRIDADVYFNWDWASPAPGVVNTGNFSVRWTGRVVPPVSGSYTFCTSSDDGVRLWVGGREPVIDKWEPQAVTPWCSNPIALVAGEPVSIRLEFFDTIEEAIVELSWSYPGQSLQPIPTLQLYAE